MSTTQIGIPPEVRRVGRQTGYGIAIAINVAALIVVLNILDWGWLPFLTDDFADVVPWVTFSLVASIAANLVYEFNDTGVVKSVGQILVNLITIAATAQVLSVFPFDFSSYSFDWAIVVRVVLILAIVGTGIAVLAEAAKLASGERNRERR